MMISLAIALGIAIGVTVLLIVSPYIYARYSGTPCPSCGTRPLERIDGRMFSDPQPAWELYRCDQCGAEFVHDLDSSVYVARIQWKGDPDAEETFRALVEDRNELEIG